MGWHEDIWDEEAAAGGNAAWTPPANSALWLYGYADVGVGGTWLDKSGNGRHATLVGHAYVDAGGLRLDGTGDYANLGDTLDMGASDFSMAFGLVTADTSGAVLGLANKTAFGPLQNRYGIYGGTGGLTALASFSTTALVATYAWNNVADGALHSVVATYQRNGSMRIIVDGTTRATTSISAATSVNMQSTFDFLVGAYNNATGAAFQPSTDLGGTINNILAAYRVWTAEEIASIDAHIRGL